MGQTAGKQSESIAKNTVDTIQYEFGKHAKSLKEINSLTYEEFKSCLVRLNELSRKCLDSNGEMTIFAIIKGTDESFLWKATVEISCARCDPETNRVLHYKLINLRQFLKVFNNFENHMAAMSTCEDQHDQSRAFPNLFESVTGISPSDEASTLECCICLERKTDLIMPCEHVFCSICIDKWKANHNKCPICQSSLDTIDDSWVISEPPRMDEVNEKIVTELNALTGSADPVYHNPGHYRRPNSIYEMMRSNRNGSTSHGDTKY